MNPLARLFPLALLAAAIAACSTAPPRNAALDQAHERYSAARADPQVSALAPDELRRASEAVAAADRAAADDASPAQIDHLAYLARQRSDIASAAAVARAAQAVVVGAAAERDKTRLAMRTAEVDSGRARLATQGAELARADADASRSANTVAALQARLKDLNARQTDRGLVVSLGGVLFYTDQSRLLPEAAHSLEQLAEALKADPKRNARIEGYTDSVGSAAYNLALSERRASSVMTALVALGVPTGQLSTRAFGEDSPAASNDSAAGRQMNRRVEVVFSPDSTVSR